MPANSGRRPRWASLRLVAVLLLAVIAAEVLGDADCDPPRLEVGSAAFVRGAGEDGAEDPCLEFCIPDCFCCARSVAAVTATVPPAPVPLSPLAAADPDDRPDGVRPPVDHPPRA